MVGKILRVLAAATLVFTMANTDIKILEAPTQAEYSYSQIDLSELESEEFRNQYRNDLPETQGDINKAYQILHEMQEESKYAYDEKDLIENLAKALAKRMEYDIEYFGSHADALIEGKGTCYHYAYLFYELTNSFGYESEVLYGQYRDGRYHV